jgi:hypothetical protein
LNDAITVKIYGTERFVEISCGARRKHHPQNLVQLIFAYRPVAISVPLLAQFQPHLVHIGHRNLHKD